ncbi:cytokine inducing-glycoprotein [Niveomyces insectorum RCEF 264]|uniref:Cytokine inducing-glycoprotein n=1 Tax=Niveomyces insectorum RCEF 264 TaxID=1081102 RepID=A0A162J205_9HYPO|nr:cytokine inducing-glycoprotein [Niveomyces insectorum RCEF 264]
MPSLRSSTLVVVGLAARALAANVNSDMGPAAFLFPDDRAYSAALDNTAPCGSVAQVGNRTDFPLTGGFVSLVDQEEAFNVQIAVSYSENPTSLDEFTALVAAPRIQDLYEGHTCVPVPNAPSNVSVGDHATLQVTYQSVWDSTVNQTFYACADITYILDADFTQNDYCFNATIGGPATTATTPAAATPTNTGSGNTDTPSSDNDNNNNNNTPSGHKGVAKGTIAGAVVGSVVGAAVLAGAGWFLYRLGAKHERLSMMRAHRNTMALSDLNK